MKEINEEELMNIEGGKNIFGSKLYWNVLEYELKHFYKPIQTKDNAVYYA